MIFRYLHLQKMVIGENFPGERCRDTSQEQLPILVMKQAVIWEVLNTLISIFRNSRHGILNIDLFTNEFVWLNVAKKSKSRVAGDTNLSFLTDYFHLTDVMNMYDFFSMMAEKIVEDSMEADVVVTDHEVKCTEEVQIIREYDFEKIRMLMEDAK